MRAALAMMAGLTLVACGGIEEASTGLGDNEGVRWANGSPDFSPARSVLLVPINKTESGQLKDFAPDDNCFYSNAVALKKFYLARGAKVSLLPVNRAETFVAALEGMAKQGKSFDRIIFLAHGGWDGPMFYRSLQIGLDWPEVVLKEGETEAHRQYYLQKAFLDYGAKINRVLAPSGWIWVGSCNSSTEGHSLFGATRYTDAMACASGRMTYGQTTKTACWDVTDRVQKLENGIKTPALWRSNPANLPAEMVCFGDELPPFPPLELADSEPSADPSPAEGGEEPGAASEPPTDPWAPAP